MSSSRCSSGCGFDCRRTRARRGVFALAFSPALARRFPALFPLLESLRDRTDLDAILLTGGTGITSRDQTYETVTQLLDKPLPGYGEVFRLLSYQEIGAAAILSRATGGLLGRKVLLTMPGSPAAVRLAMEKIIVPELPHLVREARR